MNIGSFIWFKLICCGKYSNRTIQRELREHREGACSAILTEEVPELNLKGEQNSNAKRGAGTPSWV